MLFAADDAAVVAASVASAVVAGLAAAVVVYVGATVADSDRNFGSLCFQCGVLLTSLPARRNRVPTHSQLCTLEKSSIQR